MTRGIDDLLDMLDSMIDNLDNPGWLSIDSEIATLDRYRTDFYNVPLAPIAQPGTAGNEYYRYQSPYKALEGTAAGTAAFRLYDSGGTVATTGFTVDSLSGLITFDADQEGATYYLDGRSFDLNTAAAECWRLRAASQAGGYDFRVEGRAYSRSQFFTHCRAMAEYYDGIAATSGRATSSVTIERGDM